MTRSGWRHRIVPLACAALVAACGPAGPGAASPGGPGGPPPPPAVGVVTVQPTDVALVTELPGRIEALRSAQVRARVTGIVTRRLFSEGATVKAGQPLFEIDPAPYRVALDAALAGLARAEAGLVQAQAALQRNRPLADARAISQQEWVATQAAQQQASADLAAARAAVAQARLNLDHATVTAPIAGRIGRAQVSEGALVSQAEATLLATIQQVDRLYVNVTQSAIEALRLKRDIESGRLNRSGSSQVRIVLDDGREHAHPGRLLFTDLGVDPGSGQVTLRAEVPDPRGDLLPGLYVKVRIDQARSSDAMLLPQQAVTRSAAGDSVLVVGADAMVSQRTVQLGGARGNQWVVLGGLNAGERVVVDGFQKIRPQAPVAPTPWVPPASEPSSRTAADASAAASAAPAAGR